MTTRKILDLILAGFSCMGNAAFVTQAYAQPSVSHNYNFVKLDYPGAAVSFPLVINSKRDIVGVYVDATGANRGYFYSNGKFTNVDYPGALLAPGAGTFVGGLNDRGDMAGTYTDKQGFQHGFLRSMPEGCDGDKDDSKRCQPVFHSIDVPGAAQTKGVYFELGPGLGTAAAGVNNLRQVVGLYAKKELYSVAFEYSYGEFKSIDDPASSHLPGNGSRIFSINDFGFMAGAYQTQAGAAALSIAHGFLYTGFNFIPVYVAGSEKGGFGTQANGVNIFAQVTGVYTDAAGVFHGLLWEGGQSFTVDFPGMPYSEAHSINNNGDITGAYIADPTGPNYRGFVAYRKQ